MSTNAGWISSQTSSKNRRTGLAALAALLMSAACGGSGDGTNTDTNTTSAAGSPAVPPTTSTPAANGGSPATPASAGTPATAPAMNTTTNMAPPAATSGGSSAPTSNDPPTTAEPADTGTTAPTDPPPSGDPPAYHDPGTGPWEMGTPEECKIDPGMVTPGQNLSIFRYGKLCHNQGGNTIGQNWSATKTLGGVLAGRAAYLVKDVPRTGPGTGPILHEDKATDWLGAVGYNQEALLNHIMAMVGHNPNLAYGSKSFSYDTVGSVQITDIVRVAMVATAQVPGLTTNAGEFMRTEVFAKLGMMSSSWPGGTIGYGWTSDLEDMGRVGVMLVHDGWYGGERFMEASWVYRMSHPAHEDANTAYGQLAWLSNRGGGASFGGTIDECAPPAFWPSYPHVGSEAPDCRSNDGNCTLKHDVGMFDAAGLGGQYIVVHPGLDLVIAGHNAQSAAGLWAAVRPAVVAKDPMYMGDEAAFCAAYGAGDYAPDLLAPRIAPTK
jgi:hypothetical protein